MLPKVMHQVDESKLFQQVGDKLAEQGLGLIQVHVDISHQCGGLCPESSPGPSLDLGGEPAWSVGVMFQ